MPWQAYLAGGLVATVAVLIGFSMMILLGIGAVAQTAEVVEQCDDS